MSNVTTNINNNKALKVNTVAIGTNLILNSTLTANNSYIPIMYMVITSLTCNEPAYMTLSKPPTSGLNIKATQVTWAEIDACILENIYANSLAHNNVNEIINIGDNVANGNMLTDSINTYVYNVENQLSQITNANDAITSVVTYDALGRLVEITDTNNSTGATSTRQFIWCGNAMCEARDENNALVTQYFNYGQISYSGSTGTNYYITRDELNTVREVTDGKGNLITQYNYTPYGNVKANSGTSGLVVGITSDFQYAGYYYHAASSLNITLNRAYSQLSPMEL